MTGFDLEHELRELRQRHNEDRIALGRHAASRTRSQSRKLKDARARRRLAKRQAK